MVISPVSGDRQRMECGERRVLRNTVFTVALVARDVRGNEDTIPQTGPALHRSGRHGRLDRRLRHGGPNGSEVARSSRATS